MLWLVLKVIWGPLNNEENKTLKDVSLREGFILATLCVLIFVFGFASKPILDHTQPTLVNIVKSVEAKSAYKTSIAYGTPPQPLNSQVSRTSPIPGQAVETNTGSELK